MAGIIVANIGDPITTKDGNVVTVHTFDYLNEARPSDESKVYAAADVEACASQTPEGKVGVAPQLFRVALQSKAEAVAGDPVRQPALQTTELQPGQCARGWVSFTLPKNDPAIGVALRSQSTNALWKRR